MNINYDIWDRLIDQEWIKAINSLKASVMPRSKRGGNDLESFEGQREAIEASFAGQKPAIFPRNSQRYLYLVPRP